MLLDTSGLLALVLKKEPSHTDALVLYQAADRRVIHSYVLCEWIALAHTRGVHRDVALDFANSLLDDENIEIIWVEETLHREGLALLESRMDKEYSLCDAISFVLMNRFNFTEALTTDHHFEQEGFIRLLKD